MKNAYSVMGALLIASGILGFFQNPVLGLFVVNPLHNAIHIGSGLGTIASAVIGVGAMRKWGLWFGIFYAAVAVVGFVRGDFIGLMHLNAADNWLHVTLTAFFLYFGLFAPPPRLN